MTVVLPVPETLDGRGFEALVASWAGGEGGRALFDARHVHWVSPYGILGLLAAGAAWQERFAERPLLEPPESKEVGSYLSRIRFFEHAHEIFEFTHIFIFFPPNMFADDFLILQVTQRYFLNQIDKFSEMIFFITAGADCRYQFGQVVRFNEGIHRLPH